MSQQRLVIDSLDFARQQKRIAGRIETATLGRLADLLFDRAGELDFAIAGSVRDTAGGREQRLAVSLDGSLNLVCQRCLDSLDWRVQIRQSLNLIEPGMAWPDDDLQDGGPDPIEASPVLDVLALLEDELLLALPIAPMHGECRSRVATVTDSASPFAKLAGFARR